MEKKNEIKLPQIKKTHKQSSTLLSKTISQTGNTPKMRPSSSTKVQDLSKKLFNKFEEEYDNKGKKKLSKKIVKLSNDGFSNINSEIIKPIEGYQKMQKLMPALYSKLIETKKSNYLSEQIISDFDYQVGQIVESKNKQKSDSINQLFVNTQQQIQFQKQENMMSQQQMQQIYKDYNILEGLSNQTSKKQMIQLNHNIAICENDIESLKKSMQGLIRQIGLEYINQIQKDYQYFQK